MRLLLLHADVSKLLIPGYISVQVEDSKVEQMNLCYAKGETKAKFTK